MALHAVLSAFRQLVLDGMDLPRSQAERATLYRNRFPQLSTEELEDLSKIEPDRIGVYTTSVFTAEGSILKSAFPLTLSLIEGWWPAASGSFSPRALAQAVHAVAPWRGIHSMSLGECLARYVDACCSDLQEQKPWLRDAVRLEQATLEIRKAPTEPTQPQDATVLERCAEMKVEELLQLSAYIPTLLHHLNVSYDIMPARRAAVEGDPLRDCEKRDRSLVGARPHDYGVLWVDVPEEIAQLLVASRGSTISLGCVADAFPSSDEGEEATFRAFYALIGELVSSGALTIGHD